MSYFKCKKKKLTASLVDRFMNAEFHILAINNPFHHHDKDPIPNVAWYRWNWTKWSNPERSSSLETHVTFGQSVDSLTSNSEAKISSVPCLNKCAVLINFSSTPWRSSRPSLQRNSGTYTRELGQSWRKGIDTTHMQPPAKLQKPCMEKCLISLYV